MGPTGQMMKVQREIKNGVPFLWNGSMDDSWVTLYGDSPEYLIKMININSNNDKSWGFAYSHGD